MKAQTLYAGFSRQKITPDCPCPLAGYGNALERMSEKVLDELYLTCVAITSGVDAILIFSGDVLGFDDSNLATKQHIFQATIDHTEDYLVDVAQEMLRVYNETGNQTQTMNAGKDAGVMGFRHARSIIERSQMAQTVQEMELNAVSIGAFSFVTAPYEMFCSNAMDVKAASPYEFTFVLTCTNGHNAYIANDLAFTYGSYEVHNRHLIRGTAEDLASTMVSMLEEIKG